MQRREQFRLARQKMSSRESTICVLVRWRNSFHRWINEMSITFENSSIKTELLRYGEKKRLKFTPHVEQHLPLLPQTLHVAAETRKCLQWSHQFKTWEGERLRYKMFVFCLFSIDLECKCTSRCYQKNFYQSWRWESIRDEDRTQIGIVFDVSIM